jgi:hypothetical protein
MSAAWVINAVDTLEDGVLGLPADVQTPRNGPGGPSATRRSSQTLGACGEVLHVNMPPTAHQALLSQMGAAC